jgi:hypothetical protein
VTIASSSDPEPLGFLLELPGSAALSTTDLDATLFQGESR